jgi:ectoine hydroxylase-related dioxygenase (phytanoyl-CoA dioxygenase family)
VIEKGDDMIDIGEAQIEAYRRDGFVVLGAVVDADERAELIAEEGRLRTPERYGTSAGLVVMDQLEHVSAAVRRFCCAGAHLDAVEILLGPDVALTHNQFIVKLPGAAGGTSDIPLHQDNGYGTLDPPDDITVWVALTDTTLANGCLHVAPGSHLAGLVDHQPLAANPALRQAATVETVALELAAGEAVAFSGMLLHGSGENTTGDERVALFARYCAPWVKMVTEGGRPVLDDGHSWMVRGQAPTEVWQGANDKFTG